MGQNPVYILGSPISRLGLDEAVRECAERARAGRGGYACFVNVHSLTESASNPELAECFRSAAYAFADGMPLVWVSRWRGEPVASRVCGPDFMKELLARCPDFAYGLIGGPPGQAEELARRSGIPAVCYSPPVRSFSPASAREDWERFLALCPDGKSPSVVWVGLGAPKQEFWMREVSALAPTTLFFGVGAAFDFLAGAKTRAPAWMRGSGLEWSYRLSQEPGRLWKRYLAGNSRFACRLLAETISGKK